MKVMTKGTISDRGKKYIHVNQHNIKHNTKHPDDLKPVFTIKTREENYYCHEWLNHGLIQGAYREDGSPILSCGARVVLITYGDIEVIR